MPALDPKPQQDLFTVLSRPVTRANATPASGQAAARAEKTSEEIYRLMLRAHAVAGAEYTADEVAAAIGVHYMRVRPRVSNAVQTGLLECTGAQRLTTELKTPADVHRITARGLQALSSHAPLPRPPKNPKKPAAA